MSDNRDDNSGSGAEEEGSAAERIIARFGGIRPMAAKLGVAVSTVQGWKIRGHIPPGRREQIEKAVEELGLELAPGELEAATSASSEEPPAESEARARAEAVASSTGTSLETESMEETPWRNVGSSSSGEQNTSDPQPPGVAEPTAAPERASPLPAMAIGGLLVGAGAAIAILLSDFWMPQNEPPPAAVVEALERRMARLEEQRVDDASSEVLQELQRNLEQTRVRLEEVDGQVAAIIEQGSTAPADLEALRTATTRLSERLDAVEAQDSDARLSALDSRLQELAGRVEQVAAAPAAPDDATLGRLQGIEGRIEGATGRIEALEARLQDAVAQVEAARVRVGEETAIALAAGQLREALRTGRPYAAELEGLQHLSGRDEQLDEVVAQLEEHAQTGVPTLASLQADYAEAARAAVTADRAGEADSDLQAMFWKRMNDVVSVRPTGEPEGDGTEAVLARAERRLEGGDLAAAVAELDKLQGPAADAMSDWRNRAEVRLEAQDNLNALSRVALDRLSGGEG